jgi:hypothetical protein
MEAETNPVSKTLFSSYLEPWKMEKSRNPAILSFISMCWQDAENFFADLKFPEIAKKSALTSIGLKYGGHYFSKFAT